MRFNLEIPLAGASGEPAAIVGIVATAERAGFDGVAFTDHPAPSRKWLEGGGHPTYDPFAALAFVAGATSRVRLLTYLAVLPYRNPLLTLKLVSTVDRLSGGRFTLVAGSGYLRSEFAALGRPFERRGELTDEALQLLTGGSSTFAGREFEARDQVCVPGPVQQPFPPVWIGGTSRSSRRRVARYGQGWSPILSSIQAAATTRTAPLETLDDCARAIRELRRLVADAGRDPGAISIQLDGAVDMRGAVADPARHQQRLGELSEIGVTHCMTRPPGDGVPEADAELVEAFGSRFAGG